MAVSERVRPDGKISLSLVAELDAKGEAPEKLSQEITDAYARYLTKPSAVVIMRRFANAGAFIGGNVPPASTTTGWNWPKAAS